MRASFLERGTQAWRATFWTQTPYQCCHQVADHHCYINLIISQSYGFSYHHHYHHHYSNTTIKPPLCLLLLPQPAVKLITVLVSHNVLQQNGSLRYVCCINTHLICITVACHIYIYISVPRVEQIISKQSRYQRVKIWPVGDSTVGQSDHQRSLLTINSAHGSGRRYTCILQHLSAVNRHNCLETESKSQTEYQPCCCQSARGKYSSGAETGVYRCLLHHKLHKVAGAQLVQFYKW